MADTNNDDDAAMLLANVDDGSNSNSSSTSSSSTEPESNSGLGGALSLANLQQLPLVSGLLGSLQQRKWVSTLRSLSSFANPSQFSTPRSLRLLQQRIEQNVVYFLSNYVLLSFCLAALIVLSKPTLLLLLFVLCVAWWYVLRTPVIRLGGSIELTEKRKVMAAAAVSALALFIFAGSTLFTMVGMCGAAVLAHATLHKVVVAPVEDGAASPATSTAAAASLDAMEQGEGVEMMEPLKA
jgi:hypothetical protein